MLMGLLYTLGIVLYGWALRLAAPFHGKAKKMVVGRRDWRKRLKEKVGAGEWIWMHCASLGEFEQGRPLIEAIKAQNPQQKILLTFFSPSGYEIRKNYAQADHVAYLPLDTPGNAKAFLEIVRPKMAFFVKYDLWLNLLDRCYHEKVPVVLISALVRPDSSFLKSGLKGLYKQAFARMAWIFTQDDASLHLLQSFSGSSRISKAGDTRFDRAVQLPGQFKAVEGIAEFIGGRPCIVAGSPWPKDEALLLAAIEALRPLGVKWILAPHEIHADRIDGLIAESGGKMGKYSAFGQMGAEADVLWIDNIGMLSRLYYYASAVYIGGGFGAGIHNTQEAAVYGRAVVFGPRYGGFQEAVDMVAAGGAVSVNNAEELVAVLRRWLGDAELLRGLGEQNGVYMRSMAGATDRILEWVETV